jgi:hypothetical protein
MRGGTPDDRPNNLYTAFNTRGNRGQSQYHGMTATLDGRSIWRGLSFSSKYTLSDAKDNLSSTFSDGNNGYFNLGYMNPFDPMLDYGAAEFDVRHRLLASATWDLPFLNDATGLKRTLLGGWNVSWIFTAHSGYPFTVYDCTNGLDACMRALDGRSRQERDGQPGDRQSERIPAPRSEQAGAVCRHVRQSADRHFGLRAVSVDHDES